MRVTSRTSSSKKSSGITAPEPLWTGPSGEGDNGDPLCDDYLTGVYQILNLVNGKVYVGGAYKSLGDRIRQHRSTLNGNRHFNKHLQAAWNKYGARAFRFCVLERCHPDRVQEREQYWILRKEAVNRDKGYNRSPTAGSCLGVKHTDESRANYAAAMRKRMESPEERYKAGNGMRGKHHTKEVREVQSERTKVMWENPEVRDKIIKSNTGKKRTDATRKNISRAFTGRKLSEEHKEKIRAANVGKKQSIETIEKRIGKLRGRKRPPEVVEKMRQALLGRKHGEEVRKRMGEAQRKRFEDPEQRRKISDAKKGCPSWMKGKHHTEEAKAKLREAAKSQMADPAMRELASEGAKRQWEKLRELGRRNNRRTSNEGG